MYFGWLANGFSLRGVLQGLRYGYFLLAFSVLAVGCDPIIPFVQINIGYNDVSNALFKADKNGSKYETNMESNVGDGSNVTTAPPVAEVMPELEPNEENVLGAFENLQRAFSKDKEK